MKLEFLPMRRDDRLVLHREDDVLTINGEAFDFGALPEGATLPREAIESRWFAGPVKRINGVLHFTLILPHGPQAPDATRFPEAVEFEGNGEIQLPAWSLTEENSHAKD